jgi:hypothetical protein
MNRLNRRKIMLALVVLFSLVALGRAAVAVPTTPQAAAAAKPKAAAPRGLGSSHGDSIAIARAFFERYVRLEHAFDPAQADLYADDAKIVNKRIYPGGKVASIPIAALRYKSLIRSGMAKAKAKGDISNYTNETYTLEGNMVRIKVTRYSVLMKYSSPMSQLVGPDANGVWVIHEEISESYV